MLDVAFVVLGLAVLALMGVYAVATAPALGDSAMGEPIIGLVVAVGLGLYLLYTLIHPEKF